MTLQQEIQKGNNLHGLDWISICAQLADAVRYLHFDAEVLHNDIKPDNILLSALKEQSVKSS